jgi:hypothetical protein
MEYISHIQIPEYKATVQLFYLCCFLVSIALLTINNKPVTNKFTQKPRTWTDSLDKRSKREPRSVRLYTSQYAFPRRGRAVRCRGLSCPFCHARSLTSLGFHDARRVAILPHQNRPNNVTNI